MSNKDTPQQLHDNRQDISMEQQILNAAERLFLDKGFALTTTTEIASEVGCNQALVHYYFRTKEKLFQKVFETKVTFFVKSFLDIGNHEGTFVEKLTKLIETHFDILYANPKLPLLLVNELILHPERLDALKKSIGDTPAELYSIFEKGMREEIEKGNIRDIDMLSLLISIVSLNAFIFITQPIARNLFGLSDEDMRNLIKQRRRESVTTIINSLRP